MATAKYDCDSMVVAVRRNRVGDNFVIGIEKSLPKMSLEAKRRLLRVVKRRRRKRILVKDGQDDNKHQNDRDLQLGEYFIKTFTTSRYRPIRRRWRLL